MFGIKVRLFLRVHPLEWIFRAFIVQRKKTEGFFNTVKKRKVGTLIIRNSTESYLSYKELTG